MALSNYEIKLRYDIRRGAVLPRNADSIIGNYKEPLTATPDGYGYLGALVYDKNEEFTQCHICGYFFRWLPFHVKRAHDVTSREYRDAFQLSRRTSLLATNTRSSAIQSSTFVNWSKERWEEHKRFLKRTRHERSDRLSRLNRAGLSQRRKSLEQKNIEGKCPEQLLTKIKEMADEIGRTPKRREFAKKYGYGFEQAVRTTFGNWGEAIKILDLEPNRPGKAIYDRDSLIRILWNFYMSYGREPMTSDIRTYKLPSLDVFRKFFGTFTEAKLQANVNGRTSDSADQ